MDLRQLLSDIRPLVPTYTHLLISAIFPIYAGAHASLSRPSSAEKPEKKSDSEDGRQEDGDEDEIQRMEGLSPSDAIMFPIMAGCTLAGLYFLIKWLQDPALLNRILNAYFAIFGALSVAKLLADTLGLLENLVFPNVWVRRGVVWKVDSRRRKVVATHDGASTKPASTSTNPLPGLLSVVALSRSVEQTLWLIRELPEHKWTIQLYIQHIASGKVHVGINGFISIVLSLLAAMYYNLVDKPWFLTNLMGFGFSYSALQLLSPTTFTTGALILSALFFYDIYFVFYTPMMVTVAKSLDVPIKLLFPRPAAPGEFPEAAKRSHAMLGLGDVVLPGIMIGLALRYDLFMHYAKKQKTTDSSASDAAPASEPTETTEKEPSKGLVKAPFVSLSGKYGDAFWTHSWSGRSLLPKSPVSVGDSPAKRSLASSETSFPKPFFYASVIGYLLGLLVTLAVMHIWSHAQPALLYLVPGVLFSLLVTGTVRGELTSMWSYTEEEEEESSISTLENIIPPDKDKDADGKSSLTEASTDKHTGDDKRGTASETVKVGKHEEEAVLKFSVSKRALGRGTASTEATKKPGSEEDDDGLRRSPRLKPAPATNTTDERPSKRSRVA